jgi:hypothetical protein
VNKLSSLINSTTDNNELLKKISYQTENSSLKVNSIQQEINDNNNYNNKTRDEIEVNANNHKNNNLTKTTLNPLSSNLSNPPLNTSSHNQLLSNNNSNLNTKSSYLLSSQSPQPQQPLQQQLQQQLPKQENINNPLSINNNVSVLDASTLFATTTLPTSNHNNNYHENQDSNFLIQPIDNNTKIYLENNINMNINSTDFGNTVTTRINSNKIIDNNVNNTAVTDTSTTTNPDRTNPNLKSYLYNNINTYNLMGPSSSNIVPDNNNNNNNLQESIPTQNYSSNFDMQSNTNSLLIDNSKNQVQPPQVQSSNLNKNSVSSKIISDNNINNSNNNESNTPPKLSLYSLIQ